MTTGHKYLWIAGRVFVVLFSVLVLIALVVEPRYEGRNVGATNAEIYLQDPFLALVYVGSIPVFIAAYHVFCILGSGARDQFFTPDTLRRLRLIRYCALAVIAFIALEELVILLTHGNDDATGAFAIGVLIALGAGGVYVVARKLEKWVRGRVG